MVNKNHKEIIIGYGRKSRINKLYKGISIENQEFKCKQYAETHGCDFLFFNDEGKTGANLNRPRYEAMINFVKNNYVRCIVVNDLDRLTRSVENYFTSIKPVLRKYNTTVASIGDKFDDILKLDDAEVTELLLKTANELKKDSERTKDIAKYRAEMGYTLGNIPIGYKKERDINDNAIIVPDCRIAHYIKQMFELYVTGLFSATKVGQELAKYGFISKKGKPYSKNRILDMLKNYKYIGMTSYKGNLYDANHEAIVPKELFYRVQDMFKETKIKKPKGQTYTYKGFVKCSKCGNAYTAFTKHGAHDSGTYIYYHCNNYKGSHTEQINIREEVIDEAIIEVLVNLSISNELLMKVKKSVLESVSELKQYEQKSLKELEKLLAELEEKIFNSAQSHSVGKSGLSETMYLKMINKMQQERDKIEEQIIKLKTSQNHLITTMDLLMDFRNRIPELYKKATIEEKRQILSNIIDEILIDCDAETVTVKLKPAIERVRQK